MLDSTRDRLIAVTKNRLGPKNWAKLVARMEEDGSDFEQASVALERMRREKGK